MNILLAGEQGFQEFEKALAEKEVQVTSCVSGDETLALLRKKSYAVVVVDSKLADGDGLSFVQQVARDFPLVNCALVSDLGHNDFHEATEGLGLFMQLPPQPGSGEARKMLTLLEKISGLFS